MARKTDEYYLNLPGQTFGGLTIIRTAGKKWGRKLALVKCAVCNGVSTEFLDLIVRNPSSCGCDKPTNKRGPKPGSPQRGGFKSSINWDSTDWTQQDRYIAQSLGCSRERVRQKRRELRKPNPEFFRRHKSYLNTREVLLENSSLAQAISYQQLAKSLGCGSATLIGKAIRDLGIERDYRSSSTKVPVELVNWQLGGRDLSRIWGTHRVTVARLRWLNQLEHPRWDGRLADNQDDPEYNLAIQKEIIKAGEWRRERERLVEELKAAVNGVK